MSTPYAPRGNPEFMPVTDPGLDLLMHALTDWSLYLADENGDLAPGQWATIDRLLDELGRRLGIEAT